MAKNRPLAGFECSLNYDSADSVASPVWVPIPQAKNVSIPDSMDAVEVSARSSPQKRYIAGMGEESISCEYQYVDGTGDAVFAALQAKYLARAPIQIAWADGSMAVAGAHYGKDWFVITKFDTSEELSGSKTYSLELKPTVKFNSGALVERSFGVTS